MTNDNNAPQSAPGVDPDYHLHDWLPSRYPDYRWCRKCKAEFWVSVGRVYRWEYRHWPERHLIRRFKHWPCETLTEDENSL